MKRHIRAIYGTSKIAGQFNQPNGLITIKHGEVLTNVNDEINRWIKNFEKLFTRSVSQFQKTSHSLVPLLNPLYIQQAVIKLEIN